MNHAVELWPTLVRASVDRKHPWRVVGLSTTGADGPMSRQVILRKVFPEQRQLLFFTDSRSGKVQELAHDNRVALLFWNPSHQLQLRAVGTAYLETDDSVLNGYWANVPEYARQDYATLSAPGTALHDGPVATDLNIARAHFVVLKVTVHTLDCLELGREGHTRTRLLWHEETQAWQSGAVVP